MKARIYITAMLAAITVLAACDKDEHEYPAGLPEYEHHYYLAYLPNNNSNVVVQRNQAALVKFPVQFYSAFTRPYDATTYYAIVMDGITTPAELGVDYQVVDKDGGTINPVEGKYPMTFAQAIRRTDTIYLKMLNNTAPGTRKLEVQILTNITDQYAVDNFSTAFRRPVEIR
ncbi:MAG: hypothetical protein EOO09_15155 [Chitinophagaceae bacterium]|nr:MAG: hypothetical protein EOO09_15155 [Chitinophagaceae bacterium]